MEELHKRDLYTEAMSQTAERQGRRERKKAATSSALTAAARRLVLARGYEAVTVVDIAEEADTAVTTLFKHFPDGKNAVIFGDNVDSADERMQSIITAVESRTDGQSVLDALHQFFRDRGAFSGTQSAFVRRVVEAPPLRAYAKERWERCEPGLTTLLAGIVGRPEDAVIRALARIVLQIPDLAATDMDASRADLDAIMARLEAGWSEFAQRA